MSMRGEHEADLARKYTPDYAHPELPKTPEEQEGMTKEEIIIYETLVQEMEKARPLPDDFYMDRREKAKDNSDLEVKKKYRKYAYKRPQILEAILWNKIEMANWLGPDCTTAVASEFDDEFRGTDLILEFEKDGKILRLAVDVTMADDHEELTLKQDRILDDLEAGHLTQLKYFKSELDPKTKGKVTGLPRVLIAAPSEAIKRLSALIANKQLDKPEQDTLQLELAEQIVGQLEQLRDHAQEYFSHVRGSAAKASILKNYNGLINFLRPFLEHKKNELGEKAKSKARKNVFGRISSALEEASEKRLQLVH